jgi:hypothetical protein
MPPPLPIIKGFDRQGEPEIRAGENGALELVFNFMPPMTAAGEERSPELFEEFEKNLSAYLGVSVTRDDRETFVIAKPKPESATQLAVYLSSFWKEHAKPLKAALAAVPRDPKAPFRNDKEFLAALKERLAPHMKALGFRNHKYIDLSFIRKAPHGHEIMSVGLKYLLPMFRPYANFYVTHDIVERILAMAMEMTKHEFKWRWTISGNIEKLPTGPAGEVLSRPAHLDEWVPRFVAHLKVAGLSQLESWNDLEALEQKFNDRSEDERPAYLDNPYPDEFAGRGLIIAKLLGRNNLEDIVAFHSRQLSKLACVNRFPSVEHIVLETPIEKLIVKANAWQPS